MNALFSPDPVMSQAALWLEKFVCWEAVALIGGLCLAVVLQMLRRGINLRGLLLTKDGCRESSPARVQVMFSAVAFSFYYLAEVIHDPSGFPRIPHEVLYALAGSQSFYLAAKGDLLSLISNKS